MRPRFRPREALLLYLVLLACVAGLFLVGLELGRNRLIAGRTVSNRASAENPAQSQGAGNGPVEVFENLSASSSPPSTESPAPSTSSDAPSDRPSAESTGGVNAPKQPKPEQAAPKPESQEGGAHYTIQVAAHSSKQEAQQTVLRLEAKGFGARIQPPTPDLGDHFYRVWVGEFDTIEEARAKEAEVKSAGFLTYVRKTE